jgi:hypothetical protein
MQNRVALKSYVHPPHSLVNGIHLTTAVHSSQRNGSKPEEHSLLAPISLVPFPYARNFNTGVPPIMTSPSHDPFPYLARPDPGTNGYPSECPYSLSSGQTPLEPVSHNVIQNPFGPLSLDNSAPYPHSFEFSGYSVGVPAPGPLSVEIPAFGGLPVTPLLPATCVDFIEPPVAHLTAHRSSTGTFHAESDRRRPSRDAPHPYLLPWSRSSRKRLPAVACEPDVHKLQERCIRQGGEPEAIALIPQIFAKGVHKEALVRLRTGEEVACHTFGDGPGPVYLCFLQAVEESSAEEERDQKCVTRYTCRLCPGPSDTKFSWKNERDVLRHLRKQHFGLSDSCDLWCVSVLLLSNLPLTKGTQRETRLHDRRDEEPSLFQVQGV